MSAMPIGVPIWPELAFWTASIVRTRMALASSRWVGMAGLPEERVVILPDAPPIINIGTQVSLCAGAAPSQGNACPVLTVAIREYVPIIRRS